MTVRQSLYTFLCVRPEMASLVVVRAASRKLTFKHTYRNLSAFVFGFERGLELIMLILRVIAGFMPLSFLWDEFTCMPSICLTCQYRSVGLVRALLGGTFIANA